jgi:hypothetical protein
MESEKTSKRKIWILFGVLGVPCIGLIAVSSFFGLRYVDYWPASGELDETVVRYKAAGMPWEASDLFQGGDQSKGNAAPLIRKAIKPLSRSEFRKPSDAIRKQLDQADYAGALKSIRAFASALEAGKQASKFSRLDFERDWDMGPALEFVENDGLKNLVKLLAFRAEAKTGLNYLSGAIEDLRAARQISILAGQDPTIISLMIRLSAEGTVYEGVRRCASILRGRPIELQQLMGCLDMPVQEPNLFFAMRGEAYMGISTIRNLRLHKSANEQEADQNTKQKINPKELIRTGVPEGTIARAHLARVLQHWAQIKTLHDQFQSDYSILTPELKDLSENWDKKPGLSYLMSIIMVPILTQVPQAITNREADRRATRTLIWAMNQHSLTGKWPVSIDKLPEWAKDPFTGRPLKIKLDRNRLAVYSVGSDLNDDGGVDRSSLKGPIQGRGWDVVAGVRLDEIRGR